MYAINTSIENIEEGIMFPLNSKTILISIVDYNSNPAKIPNINKYKNIFRFYFADITQEEMDFLGKYNELSDWAKGINQNISKRIAKLLILAKKHKLDVIIHCSAGVSRSGAIAEILIQVLGYKESKLSNIRSINKTVFLMILKNLKINYKIYYFFIRLKQKFRLIF